MINRPESIRVKKFAKRQMLTNRCEHVVYGVSYIDSQNNIIDEFAPTASDIKYFYTDAEYDFYVYSLASTYQCARDIHVHSLHRKDLIN